jgi:phosphoribosylformylglycinamidine cyclo-ligase
VKPLLSLMQSVAVKGMAHITGGGLVENIPRVLRAGLTAELDHRAWPLPPLFAWLQKHGGVADAEMHRVFNCGIGMAVIVAADDVETATGLLSAAGEQVWTIGTVRESREGEAQTVVI